MRYWTSIFFKSLLVCILHNGRCSNNDCNNPIFLLYYHTDGISHILEAMYAMENLQTVIIDVHAHF